MNARIEDHSNPPTATADHWACSHIGDRCATDAVRVPAISQRAALVGAADQNAVRALST
ncbi:hypothetical protein [Mycolicibacterium mengxianglii]|uniref:hypothetical protein n=1 Tax=Mycolicibacterium mengxianglii TaxID=2736649 RepID=UPI0018EF2DD6|nr:hypothetical protein [Mycolicibacterium mengxianglii]